MNLRHENAISKLLRDKTGLTITKFAKNNGVARTNLYDALKGKGSRRIRVKIAKSIQIPPSLIWQDNHDIKKMIDDVYYLKNQ
jgi:lambda repressor-like predicted transcriptional regulator